MIYTHEIHIAMLQRHLEETKGVIASHLEDIRLINQEHFELLRLLRQAKSSKISYSKACSTYIERLQVAKTIHEEERFLLSISQANELADLIASKGE